MLNRIQHSQIYSYVFALFRDIFIIILVISFIMEAYLRPFYVFMVYSSVLPKQIKCPRCELLEILLPKCRALLGCVVIAYNYLLFLVLCKSVSTSQKQATQIFWRIERVISSFDYVWTCTLFTKDCRLLLYSCTNRRALVSLL